MSAPRRSLLLALLLVSIGATGVALWWIAGTGSAPPRSSAVEPDPAQQRAVASRPAEPLTTRDLLPAPPIQRELPPMRPLEVRLELVRELGALAAPGELPEGGGARARLRGSLGGAGGAPVAGTVRFVAGSNEGRVLTTDAEGRFGANDLYPGLQIVELVSPGTPGALREIRLRNNSEEHLNVGFGMPATVFGKVVDRENAPIEGAEVTLDGQVARTTADGEFYFPRVAPGHRILALVRKAGYARFRQIVPITAGGALSVDDLVFVLEPGCQLTLSIQDRLGAHTQAQVFLLPDADARRERKFPWHEVNPTPLQPGGTVTVEDLPEGTLQIVLFHQGARSKARVSSVTLAPDRSESLVMHLEPAERVTGVVTRGGAPVSQALVTLQAPDPAMASVRALGQPLAYLEADVFPLMPPGVQRAFTGPSGEFELSGYWDSAAVRYLSVEGPDGAWAGAVVRAGDPPLALELEQRPPREAVLTLDLVGEHPGIPVDLSIDGVPSERFLLPPGEPLDVRLVPGQWQLSLRWDSTWLARDEPITVEERLSRLFRLPDALVVGQ